MVNSEYMNEIIKKSGMKKAYIAQKCGITRQSLTSKIKNRSEFTVSQMNTLCKELGITSVAEKNKLFFA